MNVKNLNKKMIDAYHDSGYEGQNLIFVVIDSGIAEIDELKHLVIYPHGYRKDDTSERGHGTSVASIIHAICPKAKFISFNVFPSGRSKIKLVNDALADTIDIVRKSSPDQQYIVNISLGCKGAISLARLRMESLTRQLAKLSVPVFVASGNDGEDTLEILPSGLKKPFCIAAINNTGAHADFSTWHDEMDFSELGVNVEATDKSGRKSRVDGTSFATPIAAAKAGLVINKIHDEMRRYPVGSELYEVLYDCAIDLSDKGYDKYTGNGLINISDATCWLPQDNVEERPLTWIDRLHEFFSNVNDFIWRKVVPAAATVEYPGKIQKTGMTNEYVRLIKDRLVVLGYLAKSTHSTFGLDTQKAVKAFQQANGITVDGMVGIETWRKLFGEDTETVDAVEDPVYSDEWTRILTVGMSGNDVYKAKARLHELGYLDACTKSTFGQDTYNAVIWMQTSNGLTGTGIIDNTTWNTLFGNDCKKPEKAEVVIPAHIGAESAKKIKAALEKTTEVRRAMVLDVLRYASDSLNPEKYPRGFYIRGGNYYNSNLTLNIMTKAKLESYLNKSAYKAYTDCGRAEMMREAGAAMNYTQAGSDCSGTVAGLWKRYLSSKKLAGVKKTCSTGFDANANTLISSYCKETATPRPGDLVWKSGHIGMIVDDGTLVAEACGGAYGITISKYANRKCYNYVDGKLHSMGAWQRVGHPVYLE